MEQKNKEILESEVEGLWVKTEAGKNILIKISETAQEVLFK